MNILKKLFRWFFPTRVEYVSVPQEIFESGVGLPLYRAGEEVTLLPTYRHTRIKKVLFGSTLDGDYGFSTAAYDLESGNITIPQSSLLKGWVKSPTPEKSLEVNKGGI